MQALLGFIFALAVTMALIPLLIRLAGRWDLIDIPDARKVHLGAIPRVGGIGMVAGVVVSALLWMPVISESSAVLLALILLAVFGMLDDKYELNYKWKFLGQAAAATIAVIYGDACIEYLPFAGMDPIPSYVGIPLSIVVLVGATNAVNLSDGLDGLAGGIVLLSLVGVLVLALKSDAVYVATFSIIVMAVIFGFLRFNTHPAVVFMGDTGSQFLGFVIALLSILLTQVSNPALNPALPLLLVGVPILDTLLVIVKRLRAGRSPFSPDRNHMHHRLLAAGFAHYEAVFLIYVAQAAFVVTAILLRYQSDVIVVGVYMVMAVTLLIAMVVLERRTMLRSGPVAIRSLTIAVGAIDGFMRDNKVPLRLLGILLPLFLIASSLFSQVVSYDVAIISGCIGLLLLVRLLAGPRAVYIPLRFLVYMVIALAVYLVAYGQAKTVLTNGLNDVFVVGSIIALSIPAVLAMRYDRTGAFKITPTDFLVLAITVTLGVVSKSSGFPEKFGQTIVLMVIAFYSAEIYMRNMQSRWNSLTVASLLVSAIIGVNGLLSA